ncbi:hypothetical protein ACM8AQ_23065 [Pseudomonas aeruginosa]
MTTSAANIRPWGEIDWILPKVGARQWKGLFCASFEPRCTAVAEWLSDEENTQEHYCLKISDPDNRFTTEINKIIKTHEGKIAKSLTNRLEIIEASLLSEASVWNQIISNVASEPNSSILIDISSLPKRFFLFAIKRLLANQNVKDLVVCYTRPEGYKEGQLTEDAEPPAALPGFSRIESAGGDSTAVISVGYMAFNLAELLEQHRGKSPKFLFPFPPGSPGFRRSWALLHELAPNLEYQTEIKRIHAMDMFAALDWIRSIGKETAHNIDLIPLGPKPHALAMALAFPALGNRAEIIYSQPRLYHPDYSHGILKNPLGKPDITTYCLKRNHTNYV